MGFWCTKSKSVFSTLKNLEKIKKYGESNLKGAYAKFFKAIIAEPCHEIGTYQLSFMIGEGESRIFGTNGGKGSVMTEVVHPSGRSWNRSSQGFWKIKWLNLQIIFKFVENNYFS